MKGKYLEESLIGKIFRYIYIYFMFALNFFISGFIINICQIILSITIKSWNPKLFRKINYYLTYFFLSQIIIMGAWYANLEIFLYVSKKDKEFLGKEHAFVIPNHTYEIDWCIFGVLIEKFHCMGNLKAYFKKSLQYSPAIGWCLYLSENIFVKRSFDTDKQTIPKQISKIVEYPDPTWVFFNAEGTRFTEEKHKISLRIAKEKQLPQLKYHLTPRTKGFIVSLPPMKNKIGAIYDVSLSFNPSESGTIKNVFKQKSMQAHIYLKRIPFNEVPEDEKEAIAFLHNIFIRKDKLQESFLTTGNFFQTSGIQKVEVIKLKKSWKMLFNHIISLFIVIGSVFYYLFNLILAGNIYNIFLVYGLLFLFSFGFGKVSEVSQIEKSSTYGMKNKP